MSLSNLEKLRVYVSAKELSSKIWLSVSKSGRSSRYYLFDQLLRASDSIGANIAEGYGRGTKPDKSRMIYIARGSIYETKYWITIADERGLINQKTAKEILRDIEKLIPQLNAYIKYLSR